MKIQWRISEEKPLGGIMLPQKNILVRVLPAYVSKSFWKVFLWESKKVINFLDSFFFFDKKFLKIND